MNDQTYQAIKVAVECAANCLARAQDNLGCRIEAAANFRYIKRQLYLATDFATRALQNGLDAVEEAD